jgi:hypothetical protein
MELGFLACDEGSICLQGLQRRTERFLPSSLEPLAHKSAIDDEFEGCPTASSQLPLPVVGVVAVVEYDAGQQKPRLTVTAPISDDSDDSDKDGGRTAVSREEGIAQVRAARISSLEPESIELCRNLSN